MLSGRRSERSVVSGSSKRPTCRFTHYSLARLFGRWPAVPQVNALKDLQPMLKSLSRQLCQASSEFEKCVLYTKDGSPRKIEELIFKSNEEWVEEQKCG